jgi:hypothetical protein
MKPATLAALAALGMTAHLRSADVRLGLRSDVYFLVRTSDESTDKIESKSNFRDVQGSIIMEKVCGLGWFLSSFRVHLGSPL